ncbi:MAG: DNA polymerase III subunits gamma and tau [bacterium ADurb.Bin374]|nr:MAG: DNA polymerase III subunits gamma and tau [bacterium ADurb.Bin374]
MAKEQASLYRRWNPTNLDEICGNAIAVAKCRTLIENTIPSKRPGFILITGEPGTGKSTLAHILLKEFGCGDIQVFNSRECGKIDFVTDFLTNELTAGSLMSNSRAFIFEEAHNITAAAQEMFMEPLEKGIPANTYVVFVTNCPEKLTGGKGALLTRPFRIDTVGVKPEDMIGRLLHINETEPLGLSGEQVSVCARYANRSVRVAINNMARLAAVPEGLRGQELDLIKVNCETTASDVSPNLRDLALAVESGSWDKTAEVLRRLKEAGEDPEGLRRGLLAWHSGTLLSDKAFCKSKRAASLAVIDALRDNYYNTGFAGLVGDLAHLAQGGIR